MYCKLIIAYLIEKEKSKVKTIENFIKFFSFLFHNIVMVIGFLRLLEKGEFLNRKI